MPPNTPNKAAGAGKRKGNGKQTELKLWPFLDALSDGVLVVNNEGRIIYFNVVGEAMFGHSRDELLDQPVETLLPERLRKLHPTLLQSYFKDPRPRAMGAGFNLLGRRKDGSEFPVDISLSPMKWRGRVVAVATVREMTERKLAVERRYDEVLDSLEAVVWEADAETWQFLFVSPGAEKLLGYPAEQWLREPDFWKEHLHPADRQRIVEARRQTIRDRTSHDLLYRMIASDGRVVWVRAMVRVIAQSGHPARLHGIIRDVTGLKSLEQELELSERRMQAFFAEAPIGLAIMDDQLRFLQINKTLADMHGLGAEEHLGKTVREVLPKFASVLEPVFQRILATGEPRLNWERPSEWRARFGPGDWVASHFPIPGTGGKPYLGAIVADTTHQKRAEEAIRKQAQLLDLANDAIVVLDMNGTIDYWNQGAERLYGWTQPEAQGKTMRALLHTVFPAPSEEILDLLLRDGHWEGELVQTCREGLQIVASSHCTLQRRDDGEPVAILDISSDITGQKQNEAEVRQLTTRLMRVQDEERRNIARTLHETTAQGLVSLKLNLELLSKSLVTPDAITQRILSESLSLAEQCTQEVRTLSYLLHPPMLDEMGLASALRWFTKGFAERSGIRVELEAAPDLERLPQEVETMLFRIAQECLTNIHRHSGSPTATIRIRRGADGLSMEVADAGSGMPEGRARAGVGIAGMRERLKQFGGRLEIQSSSRGTTVKAFLPNLGNQA